MRNFAYPSRGFRIGFVPQSSVSALIIYAAELSLGQVRATNPNKSNKDLKMALTNLQNREPTDIKINRRQSVENQIRFGTGYNNIPD